MYNKASCLVDAFSAVAQISPEAIVKHIGHDGLEVLWPELPEPFCFRGFHIQEVLKALLHWGVTASHFEREMLSAPNDNQIPFSQHFDLTKLMATHDCVIRLGSHFAAIVDNMFVDSAKPPRVNFNPGFVTDLWVV